MAQMVINKQVVETTLAMLEESHAAIKDAGKVLDAMPGHQVTLEKVPNIATLVKGMIDWATAITAEAKFAKVAGVLGKSDQEKRRERDSKRKEK